MRLSAAIWRVEAPLRAGDGQADREGPRTRPGCGRKGRGGHPPVRGRGGLGRASRGCGRRRPRSSSSRRWTVSMRPANHSKGDRSTRTAAIGSEITRFRVILGRSGCRTARSSQAQPPEPVRGVHQHIPRVHQTLVQPGQRRQAEQARSDARRERDRGPEIGFRKSHARHPE